jgi:ATP-binding cassette subfamily B protein
VEGIISVDVFFCVVNRVEQHIILSLYDVDSVGKDGFQFGKLLIVQALDVSQEIEKRSDVTLDTRWRIQQKRKNVTLSMNLGSSGLSYIGSFVTLVWCAFQLHDGKITFGELTAMTALIAQLQTPMLMLPAVIPKVIAISAACERIMEIIQVPDQPAADSADPNVLYGQLREIEAKDLSFAYDRDPVFENVSLRIPKGGLTVITGASGIGKSTLLKLLLGIYKPSGGELLLNTAEGTVPVSRSVRSLFSYAPQGNLLLSGTLRENILLARPDASEAQLEKALYVSAMDEYVAALPQGLDTVLGENGAGLSEGQSQRISLARAILADAPILLLDEVTSALDVQTEKTVLERICALPGKTCIAVTHRPAALSLASCRIEVTDRGMTVC